SGRSAGSFAGQTAPANVADKPPVYPQPGDVRSPITPGTPGNRPPRGSADARFIIVCRATCLPANNADGADRDRRFSERSEFGPAAHPQRSALAALLLVRPIPMPNLSEDCGITFVLHKTSA